MSKLKKFTIIHYSLLALSLMYSFYFYKSISKELAILAVLFELFKPVLFIGAINSKGSKRSFYGTLVIILITFNLLAISSSFINTYNKQSTSKTINAEYSIHNQKLTELKANVESIKNELNNYPSLEMFTAKSPRWEDKTALNQSWQSGKQDITNRLNAANTEYSEELSKNVDQYKVTENKMGYNAIFNTISNNLGVKTMNLILILYLLFAIMLEILIFYSKSLSNKELNNYKKTSEELTQELMQEMQLELHKMQLGAIKNTFRNNIIATIEKPVLTQETPKIDTKIVIEDVKEKQEQVKQIETSKEEKEIEVVDPLPELEEEKPKTSYQFTKKPLDIENIRKYMDYLLENSKDDIAVGYKKVAENLGLTQGEAQRIFNKLIDTNYLEKADRKTMIKKTNFNESDFFGGVRMDYLKYLLTTDTSDLQKLEDKEKQVKELNGKVKTLNNRLKEIG